MATYTNNAEAVAQAIVFDFSARKLNFATVSHRIALDALDAGVNIDEIVTVFLKRLDENDIERLFDDVVAGKMQFDVITITIEPSNIGVFVDDHTSFIDKVEVVKSAFWWACRAHLRISV